MEPTWDGLPVAADQPHGAAVVVRRPDGRGGQEYLILHRAHRGPEYDGDWAWTPPSGARLPGEPVLAGAQRELAEEAGISQAELVPVDLSWHWAVFLAEVAADVEVRLDAEHDRFRWTSAAAALRHCQPASVANGIAACDAVRRHRIAFRPLGRGDLPALVQWQQAPHVARWFPEQLELGTAGIDYAIGDARLTGIGLGPQLICAALRSRSRSHLRLRAQRLSFGSTSRPNASIHSSWLRPTLCR
ncbi:MAG TPA: NUDIX domain-containing protein [Streptosporangiaceae bacterium]|nr:NUDIX domain-containing protein [Streptosporangiaceae bacterium]